MRSGLVLSLILLAVLGTSLWFLIRAEGGVEEIPRLLQRVGIPYPSPSAAKPAPTQISKIPADFQSGNSRFSQGKCGKNSDCTVGGCSGEICSSTPGGVSTCEFSDSFPNAQGYSCECLPSKVCGWQ